MKSLTTQPRLQIMVQHVAARDDYAVFRQLQQDLNPYPYKVITDEGGPGNRTWITYRQCLEAANFAVTHLLVLQDDVSICQNFVPAVKQIAAARPDEIIALFMGNKPTSSVIEYFRACDRGLRYAQLDNRTWIPAQAILWPRYYIHPMLRFADDMYRLGRPDDELIGQFCGMNGITPIAPLPTLVQHEGAYGLESTIQASGGQYRRAVCHIGGYDPLDINWAL